MLPDYEINRLDSKRRRYLNTKSIGRHREYAYVYTRAILMYASRLLFAISWNILRENTSSADDAMIYEELFIRQSHHRETDSIEPGEFAYYLKKLARSQRNENAFVNESIDLLTRMGVCRNDQAHVLGDFVPFFETTECILEDYAALFEGKKCEYLIPCSERNEQGVLQAYCLGPKQIPEDSISIRVLGWERPEEKLFYRIIDMNTGDVTQYCLSPFISYGALESFYDEPNFWAYQHIQNASYSGSSFKLCYTKMQPNIRENTLDRLSQTGESFEIGADFEERVASFRLSDMFLHANSLCEKNRDIWYQSHYSNRVRINISAYPGFDDIIQNKYLYCEDICVIKKDVLDFCKDLNQQMLYVCGNGGVGKTALLLSILNQFNSRFEINPYTKKPVYGFTHLMFFSAKHLFYSIEREKAQTTEGNADIQSYSELLEKLSVLLDVPLGVPFDEEKQEVLLLERLKHYPEERFLMVIDDLDSLPLPEQRKVENFVCKNDARVVKTILTTRFLMDESKFCMRIRELDDAQSLCYARWVLQSGYHKNWNEWTRASKAIQLINRGGNGNPLRIKALIAWIEKGLEFNLDVPATKMEMDAYFFNTVQNILNDAQKQMLEIARRIFTALPTEHQSGEINKSLLMYLCAGVDLHGEDFIHEYDRLKELKLLFQTTEYRIKLYDTFIIDRNLFTMGSVNLPRMYRYIFNQIEIAPAEWICGQTEKVLYECIVRSKTENKGKYAGEVAMKIFECMAQSPDISQIMSQKIQAWMSENSINAGKESVAERLIQSIESQWEELKELYDCGGEAESLQTRLQEDMNTLLKMKPAKEIMSRLKRVAIEKNQYE